MGRKKRELPPDDLFLPFDLVLARVAGSPWRAGCILDDADASEDAVKHRPVGLKKPIYAVRIFPKGDISWLCSVDLAHLSTDVVKSYIKHRASFDPLAEQQDEDGAESADVLAGYRFAVDADTWQRAYQAKVHRREEYERMDTDTAHRQASHGPNKNKSSHKHRITPPESEGEEGGPEQVHEAPVESTTAALYAHPEVASIREWRRSIHKAFHDHPDNPLRMAIVDRSLSKIEAYKKITFAHAKASKLITVLKRTVIASHVPSDDILHIRYRAWCLLDKWRRLPKDLSNDGNPMQELEVPANWQSTVNEGAARSDTEEDQLPNEDDQLCGRKRTVEDQEAEGM
ncbi:hypothetical protein C8F01DRAFT_1159970 [Mycena amicta]|nr:hypothetical protein C8F01DRAFT_1159970 [Mycena amicta]